MRYAAGTFAVLVLTAGCTAPPQLSESQYSRGSTSYTAGRLSVQQPDIQTTPERSVRGFRVAGPDTDLDVDYWNVLHEAATRSGSYLAMFGELRARHRDLEVYQSGAAEAAFREFRRYANTRGFLGLFDGYWRD